MNEKIVKKLNGHSGCNVFLIHSDDNLFFVRKISKDISYNSRLEKQFEKQSSFVNSIINAPKVLNSGYINGFFFFDMEFIKGTSLSAYLETINVCEIPELVEKLFSFIIHNEQPPVMYSGHSNDIFRKKIDDLSKAKVFNNDNTLMGVLLFLKQYDWSNFKSAWCHGDFTTENLIVNGNNSFYAIDFLDSFFDCWQMDVATLLQDVECLWAYRKHKQIVTNTKIRAIIFRDNLLEKVNQFGHVYIKDVYCALLLKLLRICPYCDDTNDIAFLKKCINNIFRKVK